MSGLITGLDSATLIKQLMQLEQQPITRMQNQITKLQAQQSAIQDLRTQLTTLQDKARDFRLSDVFNSYKTTSSDDTILKSEVSGTQPLTGSYVVNVTQLANATVAKSSGVLGGIIDPSKPLSSSGITSSIEAGTFTINGVQFNVDPTTQSLNDMITAINSSSAGVTASYDVSTDRLNIKNTAANNTNTIKFGVTDDTSTFLSVVGMVGATQLNGSDGATSVSGISHLGAVSGTSALNTQSFSSGAVTAGTFSVNGVSFSIDPTTDSIGDILTRLNSSDAGVTASYDTTTDTIQVISNTLGSRTIRFGSSGDTSNFLDTVKLSSATQTAGKDAQFSINGGSTQTWNTNDVSGAVGGVTLHLLSEGKSTVTVGSDDDAIVSAVKDFVTEFNNSISKIADLTANGAALASDGSLSTITSTLWQDIFANVSNITGSNNNLISIGITTGSSFDYTKTQSLSLDESTLRTALRDDRFNVQQLFSNSASTGIADMLSSYLDGAAGYSGFLNQRAGTNGTISDQITALNDNITRTQDNVNQKTARLKKQFAALETMSNSLKSQSSALSALG
jgi:flagellar hook-associated protein 2